MFSEEVIIETLKQSIPSAAIFLVLWFILGKFVFKSYLNLLDERDERTRGDEKRALSKAEAAGQVLTKIQDELRLATIEGLKVREVHIRKAKSQASDIISEAASKSKLEIETARDEIIKLRSEAKKEMRDQIESITESVMSKVLTLSKHGVDASSVH